jgi:peptidoglycan/LPS O-acetylase OafA/YrhL
MKRIKFLDGLRGIAIVLVICFHAFSRWPLIVPYGNSYGNFLFFKYGYLGVQLFFLISGFVILMSLEKNKFFLIFIYKRWLRLFPAMLVATILLYLTAPFLYERPGGIPNINSVLPGLTFIDPRWIKIITGVSISPLEGVFWSLFVEFKFYFIFGVSYFILGKEKAIMAVFSMYLLSIVGGKLNIHLLSVLLNYLSFEYFGWFASGSLAYLYFISKKHKYLFFSILAALFEIYKYRYDSTLLLFCIFILLLFFIPIYFEKTRILVSNPLLLFFGFISYPLYLIHENAMIALICKISKFITIPYLLLPIVAIFILIFISYLIVKIVEPFVRKMIIQISIFAKSTFNKSQVRWYWLYSNDK